jgi:hypothetical protein
LLKQKTSASKIWTTRKINVGTPDAVSRYVSEFKARGGDTKIDFTALTTKVMTCSLFTLREKNYINTYTTALCVFPHTDKMMHKNFFPNAENLLDYKIKQLYYYF